MRICLIGILALLLPADYRAGAKQNDEVGGIDGYPQIKLERKKGAAQNRKLRQFHLEYQIEFLQLTEGTNIGGTTVPGRMLQHFHSTFDVQDGDTIVYRGDPIHFWSNDRDGDSLLAYSISLDTVDKTQIRLQVSTQDKRTYTLKDGSRRSWNLRLHAAKTVKLGQEFKLELTDDSSPGIKVSCQGLIEEKASDLATDPPKELDLSYQDFDQRPGQGWRKIADQGKYVEAARLIDWYEKEKKGLEEWQRVNLRFHAGQLYTFADQKEKSLARFKSALYRQEPADSPIRWNAYVNATIAFLERDRKKLTKFREEIAQGPKVQGVVPNLDVVDRLIQYFDEPYSVAYTGKPRKSK